MRYNWRALCLMAGMTQQKVIMGAFRSLNQARDAIHQLEEDGVAHYNISLIGPERARDEFAQIEKKTKAAEGAGVGGAAGVAIGALAAGLTAVASLAIPGVGILAAGPLVAALAGAGAGGVAGGIVGSLVGLGLTEHEAHFNTSVLKEGGYIVAVTTEDERERKTAANLLGRLSVKSDQTTGAVAHL